MHKKVIDAIKLLMSGAFRARCERYLRAITGNYRNRLVFQPGKVCTDGETVWADPTSGLIADLELARKIIAVRGQIAHEAFHILYTDFTSVKRWAQEAKRMSPEDQFRLRQRKDFLNIVEDSAIELAGCTEFPGLAPYIRLLNETAFEKMNDLGWYEQNTNRLRAFMNACMMYGIIGRVKGSFTDPELIEAFEQAKAHMDAGRVARTTRDRQKESDAIWEIAKPFIEEQIALGQLQDLFENLKGDDVNENGNGQGRPMPADPTEFRKPRQQNGGGQDQEQESDSQGDQDEEQSKEQSKGSKSKKSKPEKKDEQKSDSKSGQGKDEEQGGSDSEEEQEENQRGGGSSGQDDSDGEEEEEQESGSGSGKDQDDDEDSEGSSDSDSSGDDPDEEEDAGNGESGSGDDAESGDDDGDSDDGDQDGDQENNQRSQHKFADDADDDTIPSQTPENDGDSEDDELLKELQKEVEKEIEEVLSEMEKEQLAQSQSEKRAERVKNHLANLKYSDNHANIKVRPYYPDPTDYDKSVVKEIEADVKSLSRNMTRRIQNLIRYNQEEKRSGLTNGYLNQSELWRKDGKIFAQKKDKSDEADLAILVLVDESGSMEESNRYKHARKAAVMIANVCEALRIPLAIMGHQAIHRRNVVEHYHYVTFERPLREQVANLARITHRQNTREGISLKYAAEYLMQQPQRDKLLLVISDGDPFHVDANGNMFTDEPARTDAALIVEEYEKKGMTIVGIAIGEGKDYIAEIYKNFISISKLEMLPQKLVSLIEKRVLKEN